MIINHYKLSADRITNTKLSAVYDILASQAALLVTQECNLQEI